MYIKCRKQKILEAEQVGKKIKVSDMNYDQHEDFEYFDNNMNRKPDTLLHILAKSLDFGDKNLSANPTTDEKELVGEFLYTLIKYFIQDEEIKINERDHEGNTALHIACSDLENNQNKLMFVKMMIRYGNAYEKGNWIDYRSNGGVTALAIAAATGKREICTELISQGKAKVGEHLKDNWTALAHAIKNSKKDIVKLLIETFGAKLNIRLTTKVKKGEKNRTLLMLAIIYSDLEIIEYLMTNQSKEIKKQVNITDDADKTCLYLLASSRLPNNPFTSTETSEDDLKEKTLTHMVQLGMLITQHTEMYYRFYHREER